MKLVRVKPTNNHRQCEVVLGVVENVKNVHVNDGHMVIVLDSLIECDLNNTTDGF